MGWPQSRADRIAVPTLPDHRASLSRDNVRDPCVPQRLDGTEQVLVVGDEAGLRPSRGVGSGALPFDTVALVFSQTCCGLPIREAALTITCAASRCRVCTAAPSGGRVRYSFSRRRRVQVDCALKWPGVVVSIPGPRPLWCFTPLHASR